ncbi:MAG: hypothetical protein ACC628_10475 [Pirellulaceae bacterium]
MSASGSKSLATIGFLTVREYSGRGLFGGYLVLNTAGRPLEFHCTAPVRPSRAQEILYGPTLQPFLYGEQIGQTLVNKAVSKPLFVCTDVEPALALRDNSKLPLVLVLEESPEDADDADHAVSETYHRLDATHPSRAPAPLTRFTVGQNRVAVPQAHATDQDAVLRVWERPFDSLDLREPFTRIHEAIEEAQRGPGRGA